jgi:SAM-dependent methyltransferase
MAPEISYERTTDEAWTGYGRFIAGLIEKHGSKRICEIGGGANPALTAEYIQRRGLDYSILDVSETELNKAPENYHKIVADIGSPDLSLNASFDLVFSRMLAEHIKDGERFHRNIYGMLSDGGLAVHFLPTFYTLPFVINRLFPEAFAEKLYNLFAYRDAYRYGKFPAYYSWCRGPIRSQIRKFEKLGYEIILYKGFFGHRGYYKKLPFLRKLHELKTEFMLRRPIPLLTSYAYIVLRKA